MTTGGTPPSRSAIIACALHPAAAFAFATFSFVEYEDAQIGVSWYTWDASEQFEVTFQDMLGMMFFDFVYLGACSLMP